MGLVPANKEVNPCLSACGTGIRVGLRANVHSALDDETDLLTSSTRTLKDIRSPGWCVYMYIVNENAACVLVALIAATALCGVYGMFLLLSKGVRILDRIRRKGLRTRPFSQKEDGSQRGLSGAGNAHLSFVTGDGVGQSQRSALAVGLCKRRPAALEAGRRRLRVTKSDGFRGNVRLRVAKAAGTEVHARDWVLFSDRHPGSRLAWLRAA
jgi:hypothetical protein